MKMQTSGDQRRENVELWLRRMGGAQRYPSPHAPALMGIAALHPSYKTANKNGGNDPAVLKSVIAE
jgi:hypothetical protein